jgi:hypothetical protein
MTRTLISIPADSHFITGQGGKGKPILFRPYTQAEWDFLSQDKPWTNEICQRILDSPEEPGDVELDLGSDELNWELLMLINKALNKKWGVVL